MSHMKPFTGYTDSAIGLDWKHIKMTREAEFADEEAAATFLAEFKRLIMFQYYPWFQASNGVLEQILHGWELGGWFTEKYLCNFGVGKYFLKQVV